MTLCLCFFEMSVAKRSVPKIDVKLIDNHEQIFRQFFDDPRPFDLIEPSNGYFNAYKPVLKRLQALGKDLRRRERRDQGVFTASLI